MLRENLGRIPIFIAISAIYAILLSSSFVLQINQGAWAGTFPGENGQIAISSYRDGNYEIYVLNADGSELTRLTDDPSWELRPSWSPDGKKIAFSSSSLPEESPHDEIHVMNADGSDVTRLTGGFDPSWSPDGTKIAFVNGGIYVINVDGSGQTRLTADGFDPSWSPDGTKIAFVSYRDRTDASSGEEIYVMNAVDGSNVTNLSNNCCRNFYPSWSPDGEKIAFESFKDGNTDIYIMNAVDGSGQTRLTTDTAANYMPSWSPDGEKIAFTSKRDGNEEIYVMNAVDGSGQTRLTNNPEGDFEPDWGPATEPPEEDTTPPALTVPEDITEEATSPNGAQVTYTVTAQDDVDGNATLEEDGTTVTQDDIGGDIDISCEPASGTTFPIGDTEVECSATDEAGNTGTASFTVTVNPPSPSPPTPAQEAIDELISTIQNLDNVPQDVKTSLIAVLNEVLNILNDNNPNNDESACGTLDAFINQVNANERSDTLTADVADELSTQSEEIRNALNC